MGIASPASLRDVSRRILRLQVFTLLWMAPEAAVSLGSAWNSHSPTLLAFGEDSLVELLSAGAVFWRFRFSSNEGRAARIAGALLLVLAGLVLLASVLDFAGYREAQRGLVGMGILLVAAVVMPWLGRPCASRQRWNRVSLTIFGQWPIYWLPFKIIYVAVYSSENLSAPLTVAATAPNAALIASSLLLKVGYSGIGRDETAAHGTQLASAQR